MKTVVKMLGALVATTALAHTSEETLDPLANPAFEGVKSVWVSASQWPNARTQETFAKDAIRLYGAANGSPEKKAQALYYYALRVMGHGGDYFQGPYGREVPIWDHWMIFHSYAKAFCEHWSWFLIDLWKAYNNNWEFGPNGVAQKIGINAKLDDPSFGTHVEAALKYTDTDGVTRWHMFDGERGFFARARGTNRVATPEEIHAEFPTLLTNPFNPPHPFFMAATAHGQPETDSAFHHFLGNTYPFMYSASQRRTKYSTDFDLRVGESINRFWYDNEKPVVASKFKTIGVGVSVDGYERYVYPNGQPKDPYNYPVVAPYMKSWPALGIDLAKPFGTANSVYTPTLTDEKYKQGAMSSRGLASGTGVVKLKAAAVNMEGSVVYQIRSIYPISESFITGKYYLKSAGRVAIDFSLDMGKTWVNVLNSSTVSQAPLTLNLNIGKGRWDQKLSSPYNMPDRDSQYGDYSDPAKWATVKFTGYQYLVRVRILSTTKIDDVGFANLSFRNSYQLNIGMLPTLLPGANKIKVEGTLTAGTALKVEYSWMESGVTKNHIETVYSLPYEFTINVNEPDPLKVKCLHQDTSAIPK